MVLRVPVSVVPLILPMEELNVLLGVLLAHMVEPQIKASKLVNKELVERNLL